jgi:glycosyltransferase involved in cell wall biosynthesis
MRILHVTLGFYPAEGWGGPVKSVHRTCSELVRRGHQVTIFCTNLFDKRTRIKKGTFEREYDGIKVRYFDTWNLPWWPGTLGPIWMPELPKVLKEEVTDYEIIHLHGYRSFVNLPIVSIARKNHVPVVMQPRGTLPIVVNSYMVKNIYDIFFGRTELNNVNMLIALQDSELRQALAQKIPRERVEIIPNGIDIDVREKVSPRGEFRIKFGIPIDCRLILFLGRINRKKGTDMLVEAFAELHELDSKLVIAGPDDGQLTEVKSKIAELGLQDKIYLSGLLDSSDVLSAFQDADLFVLPSRTDTFPNTIIESCLMGTPMVVTDTCEISDMVKDRVASVVPFDKCAFADAMRELLTNHSLYEKYRLNCSTMIANTFSIQAVVDRLLNVYERLISESRALND